MSALNFHRQMAHYKTIQAARKSPELLKHLVHLFICNQVSEVLSQIKQ